MSGAISMKIRQLEVQNKKLRRLLESTFEITRQDAVKCQMLTMEANALKRVVADLENQKMQLEDELKEFSDKAPTKHHTVDIECRLNDALDDIHRGSSEIEQLSPEGPYLIDAIAELEKEKELLVTDIELVKRANEQQNALVQENLVLKQEIAILEAENAFPATLSGQDLVNKLICIEELKVALLADISAAKLTTDPLGIPIENTVLELKICGLEKQKDTLLKNLKTTLLQSANEISMLHSNTSDNQLRGLLNELDIHKTILMMNLTEIKEMHSEAIQQEQRSASAPDISIVSSEPEEYSHHDLATVSEEEEEPQNDLVAEHEQLEQEINRLESEREELLRSIQNANKVFENNHAEAAVVSAVSSEELCQKLPMDDATNQMYVDEEQQLVQRIKELEEDNERIRRDLNNDETVDMGAVLEEGERLIRDYRQKN